MKKKAILRLVSGLSLLLTTMSCGSNESNEKTTINPVDIKSITYEFDDATLPIENQRSYAITAEPDRVTVIMENYESVYADETYEITEEKFTFIKNALQRNLIRNCPLSSETECENGTMESISYSDSKAEIFYGSVYHCNLRDTGNLCGDYKTFSNRMKELIPNFEQLLLLNSEVE